MSRSARLLSPTSWPPTARSAGRYSAVGMLAAAVLYLANDARTEIAEMRADLRGLTRQVGRLEVAVAELRPRQRLAVPDVLAEPSQ